MGIESSKRQYPLPVVGCDWDNTFNNTKLERVYQDYSTVWYPSLGRSIHKDEELVRDFGRQTGYVPGEGMFTINGIRIGSTSDVYSDHTRLGHIIIDKLIERFPNDPHLPSDEEQTDELLNRTFRECKPQVEIPFRPDAYSVFSQLFKHHLNGDFFFFIYTSSQPESVRAALPKLDPEIAEEFNEKGEIFQCIKHIIAKGNRFARTPDGIPIPKTVYYDDFKSETSLRRPMLYKGLMRAEVKAHGLKEGEVVDLRDTNTILVDDGCENGLALPRYLGATTVLFGNYGPTEFASEITSWNGKPNMNPKRYAVDSLSAALLVIYQCTGIKVDVNNIDMLNIVLNALENDYTLRFNLHTPLSGYLKEIFESSNMQIEGMTLKTRYEFIAKNAIIAGRNNFRDEQIFMHYDSKDDREKFGLYGDKEFIENWKKNEVEDI